MRPFDGARWWPLALFALTFVVLVAVAARVSARRDLGLGIPPERRGPAEGGRALRGTFGLVWRLERAAIIGWAVAGAGFGLSLGSLAGAVTDLEGAAREWYTTMGGTDQVVDAFHASMVQMIAMAAAVFVVQMLLRMRSDEVDGRVELLLASTVTRVRVMAVHVLSAVLGATGFVVVFAAGLAATGDGDLDARLGTARVLVGAGLSQMPAVMAVGGLVAVLVGVAPRWAGGLAWSGLGAAILLGPLLGPGLGVPRWVRDLSPFTHAPKAPAADVAAAPLVVLAVVCAAVVMAATLAYRRRNLALPV